MKKASKKMAKLNREYSKLRKEFLENNPLCNAVIDNCGLTATDVHHMKGRGLYHLDIKTWLPVCRSCHMWIETHPEDAKELGFSISKSHD